MFAGKGFAMSATTLPIEGSFFFTEVDPEVALK
jgi:hypothetical protein